MKQLFIIMLALFTMEAKAQSLIDTSLESSARQALIEGIKEFGDNIRAAGVVIMETSSGNVVANVSICKREGIIQDIPNGNEEEVPAGIGRAVLYLSMMDKLKPNFEVDAQDGLYRDSLTGCTIIDLNHHFGGYGILTLKQAFDHSDVGMIKAAEVAFNKSMNRYDSAIKKTGIFFDSIIDDDTDNYYDDELEQPWTPCDIIGYKSKYSLLQQTAWVNMVANRGKLIIRCDENDPVTPFCEIKNKAGLDSLASAMLESVEDGLERKMKLNSVHVAGLADVTPADAHNCRGCFAAAFLPYESPKYTIGVYVNKHGSPAGRIIPTRIAGKIVRVLAKQDFVPKIQKERNMKSVKALRRTGNHPAEK